MWVGVLGPLEVRASGRPVQVAGPIPRRLLALLAARPGRFVPVGALIDGVWGDDPPAAARATLQSHMARLRRSLGGPAAVAAGPAGYRLAVDAADVDAFTFAAAVRDGHVALAGGDPAAAAAALGAGLALWRGPAFAEFGGCAALEAEAARLEQLRLDAVAWRIEAELAAGASAAPVGELEALVREHPTREGLWALLMRALYRAGRQADALEAYRRARRALVDELGVEPGRQLRETERLVLAHDPSLDPPPTASTDAAPVPAPDPEVPSAARPPVPAREAGPPEHAEPEPAAERRMVVVAVVELPVGAADPEEVAAQNLRFRDLVRDRIDAYGGVVCAVTGGTSVAIFGVPLAHEDDAVRAVRAASAIARDWPGSWAPRAGVSAGEVVVTGEVTAGSVSGPPLAGADRLRTLAQPGDLVVDEPVRELIGPADAELMPGPGPQAWRLIGLPVTGAASAATRFVGRSRDLAVLRAAFGKTAGERAPQLVTILGEAGIGKSRLVTELKQALDTSEGEVVWRVGYCRPYGDGTLLSALADIVKAHAGITDTDATETAMAKIRAALPADEHRVLEPRLAPLVGVDPGGYPEPVRVVRRMAAFHRDHRRAGACRAGGRGPALGRAAAAGLPRGPGGWPCRHARPGGGHGPPRAAGCAAGLGRGRGQRAAHAASRLRCRGDAGCAARCRPRRRQPRRAGGPMRRGAAVCRTVRAARVAGRCSRGTADAGGGDRRAAGHAEPGAPRRPASRRGGRQPVLGR
jgi:DNA-binding SARP family transcriptional activator